MDAIGAIKPERLLAADGSGANWLARDKDLDRHILVSLHVPSTSEDAEPLELQRLRFIEYGRALAAVDHPNVARVLDYGRMADGQPYYTLPGYRRRLTERLAEDRPLSIKDVNKILEEALSGLEAAHHIGIAHGAIGPEAILLTRKQPQVKLAGFTGKAGSGGVSNPTMVADVFAIGLMAYRLLAGQMPSAKAPRPSELNTALPAALEKWTMRCLASNPDIRPADAVAARAQFFAAKKAA